MSPMLKKVHLVYFVLALSCLAASVGAEEAQMLKPEAGETIGAFKKRIRNTLDTKKTLQRVAAQPSTPTAAGGFGSRVQSSLSNFLPIFDFAIDAVDTATDQKSVTVSFSPIPLGKYGDIDVTATIAEPTPFESLLNEIPEATRTAQKDAITKQLDDFSDILWSATYGLQWKAPKSWRETGPMLFGRDPRLYDDLISELMDPLWEEVHGHFDDKNSRVLGDCEQLFQIEGSIDDVVLDSVKAQLDQPPTCSWQEYVEALIDEQRNLYAANQELADSHIDRLAAMIDNQPQLTLTASQRERDPLVGQDETSFTLKFELGRKNLNTALRQYRDMREKNSSISPREIDAFKETETEAMAYDKKNKFTFALVWRQRDAYSHTYDYVEKVTDPTTGSEVEIPRIASLDLDERDEWCGMVQWSRSLPKQKFRLGEGEATPRAEGSIEYVDVQGDPMRKNRFVARLSYLLPAPGGMTLPITVTWADKSEFLGEQDKVFGAHVGVSFKMGQPGS